MSNMKQKRKVCVLLPEHYSSNMGGAEYQAKLLVEALINSGKYEITYLCNRSKKEYEPEGYRIVTLEKLHKLIKPSFLSISIFAYQTLHKIDPDIIYQNVGGIFTGIAAYYANKHKKRLIWHIASDDDIVPQWKGNVLREVRLIHERLALKYAIKHSDIIAAQTRHQAKLLKTHYGIETNHFIPIGHPLPNASVDRFERLTILWIANLKPLKRPEKFVELARRFSALKSVSFKMIGQQGWGRWFEDLKKEINHLPNIEYLGRLPQEEVNAYLRKSHILINTSIYEGFSNTFVQAWLRGCQLSVCRSILIKSLLMKK
jgi:glycosyltransferase involved in cell wall biosynthesis